jgi:hypothetical protein
MNGMHGACASMHRAGYRACRSRPYRGVGVQMKTTRTWNCAAAASGQQPAIPRVGEEALDLVPHGPHHWGAPRRPMPREPDLCTDAEVGRAADDVRREFRRIVGNEYKLARSRLQTCPISIEFSTIRAAETAATDRTKAGTHQSGSPPCPGGWIRRQACRSSSVAGSGPGRGKRSDAKGSNGLRRPGGRLAFRVLRAVPSNLQIGLTSEPRPSHIVEHSLETMRRCRPRTRQSAA